LDDSFPILDEPVDGVFAARQLRSRKLRDAYVEAGLNLLNTMRFKDMRVTFLAEYCGYSVGSFYTRFEDKDAYFRALRAAAVALNRREIEARMTREILVNLTPDEVLDALVDLLADIFSGKTRGVLRESLLRILEPEDAWAPMRESGKEILNRIIERLETSFPPLSPKDTGKKLSFCYQIIVGVLQNDLVNDFHVFSTKDHSIRAALKTTLRDNMASLSTY